MLGQKHIEAALSNLGYDGSAGPEPMRIEILKFPTLDNIPPYLSIQRVMMVNICMSTHPPILIQLCSRFQ